MKDGDRVWLDIGTQNEQKVDLITYGTHFCHIRNHQYSQVVRTSRLTEVAPDELPGREAAPTQND